MYFGGFDPNGHTSTNNAWVYKRTWSTLDVDEQKSQSIINYKVHNNYPNPFNPSTNIPYTILKDEFINIVIYDLIGNRVKLLVNEYKDIGNYIINWNGKNENDIPVSAGVYLYSIEAGEFQQTKKMILLK